MTDPSDPDDAWVPLPAGTRVDVRTGFDDSWSSGFAVEEHSAGGYRLRRRSDQQVLPTEFAPHAVRRERKNSMWWH